jgi:hypothetical protein
MRKLLFISLFIITFLSVVVFFFVKRNNDKPIDILYDGKPHKIKPEITSVQKQHNSLSIYENLYTEKKPTVIENILSSPENPVSFDNNLNQIDKIINHLLKEHNLQDYKGIKIFLINDAKKSVWPNSKVSNHNRPYVLDLGLYQTKERALEKLKTLSRSYSKLSEYNNSVTQKSFDGYVLYNLQIENIKDFGVAFDLCNKMNKNNQECVIINLYQIPL